MNEKESSLKITSELKEIILQRILSSKLPENIKLMIVGTGQLAKSLKLQVTNSKLQNRIQFLGEISQNKLPAYLAASDIFIRPSLSEGLGISFLEAMAAGLPVIGTPVGGIPDFLKDDETGLLCEPNNPASIVEKINLLLNDDLLRQRIIENARKLVIEKYSWDKISQQIRAVLTFT